MSACTDTHWAGRLSLISAASGLGLSVGPKSRVHLKRCSLTAKVARELSLNERTVPAFTYQISWSVPSSIAAVYLYNSHFAASFGLEYNYTIGQLLLKECYRLRSRVGPPSDPALASIQAHVHSDNAQVYETSSL